MVTTHRIDAGTRLYCLIGDPVGHSMSPSMHNAAFLNDGTNAVYLAFRIDGRGLEAFLRGAREMGISGINVTIPHKSAVMAHLDGIDDHAQGIGAVNVIENRRGDLIGHNTDGRGAMDALRANGFIPFEGKKALLIGAGHASRAIGYCLAECGMDILITNRSTPRARELAAHLSKMTDARVLEEGEEDMKALDLVINCTPLGMAGFPDEVPLDPELLNESMTVMDVVYNPKHTRFLDRAKDIGARTVQGHDMLLWQGARSYEIWTGSKAPVEVMKRALIETLGGGWPP
ncbi:MAG: shikimate dehydrogenase [Candidatus Thermoplasmatota archaeon]|nr:shikimate dehydrogenase [Candidatus Thermoplasmatota archaeon]